MNIPRTPADPEPQLFAQRVLAAANTLLAVLDTPEHNVLTEQGIALQHASVNAHYQTVLVQPDLATHPAFQRYLLRLGRVLPHLAESLGQTEHAAYQEFLRYCQLGHK